MLEQAEKTFKIFADKNRIRIIRMLQQRKMCVCELAYVLGVTQPSVSRHLKKMKAAGLVFDEQDRFWTNYVLNKKSKDAADALRFLNRCLAGDRTLKGDLARLKKADRTRLCCR